MTAFLVIDPLLKIVRACLGVGIGHLCHPPHGAQPEGERHEKQQLYVELR
jgi:hypothetical protein